jgi:hypothetical protein
MHWSRPTDGSPLTAMATERNRGRRRCGLRGAGNNVYGNCKDDVHGRALKLTEERRAEEEEKLHGCVMDGLGLVSM